MTEKHAYSYVVLRYVHDVVAGEAINVGVVMYVPSTASLKVKTRERMGPRLRHMFPDLDREAFVSTMRAVERGFSATAKQAIQEPLMGSKIDASFYALKVIPKDDSSLQWSTVSSGLTSNDTKTFESLYQRYVGRYDTMPDKRRTDDDVWRPVRDKLLERGISVPFDKKIVTGAKDSIEFKKAWKNGKWHAYEPLSMDLAEADGIKDKARRYLGHLSAVEDGAPKDIEIHFILGRPQKKSLMPAYRSAREILKSAPFEIEVVDEENVDALVSEIEDEFRAHQHAKTD